MNHSQSCGLCKSEAQIIYKNYPGYQEPKTYDIYHCSNCNTGFPYPAEENFEKLYDLIYENKERIKGYNRYFRYSKEIKFQRDPFKYLAFQESAYFGVWKTLHRVKNPGTFKVLEVGAGLGYLTYALKHAGFDVLGIDISEKVVEQAKLEFGELFKCLDIFEYAKITDQSYDYIVMTEVIEHVPEPAEFIRVLLSLLSEKGKLIVTTPNKGLYNVGTVWASDIPPVHLWWLSEESLKNISSITESKVEFLSFEDFYKKNVDIVDIGDPNFPVIPPSILDINGEVKDPFKKEVMYERIKVWALNNKVLLKLYVKFRLFRNPNLKKLSSQGNTICAVFERS